MLILIEGMISFRYSFCFNCNQFSYGTYKCIVWLSGSIKIYYQMSEWQLISVHTSNTIFLPNFSPRNWRAPLFHSVLIVIESLLIATIFWHMPFSSNQSKTACANCLVAVCPFYAPFCLLLDGLLPTRFIAKRIMLFLYNPLILSTILPFASTFVSSFLPSKSMQETSFTASLLFFCASFISADLARSILCQSTLWISAAADIQHF